jgi:endonuclease/exonuclease/phosphatase (EEP) superfamily protein YafD
MTTSTDDRTSFGLNRWIFFAFVGLIVVISLLSLAGYLGNLHRYFEITNAFKAQYLTGAIAAFVYFFLTQRQQWVVVSLVCIFINCLEVIPWYMPPGMAAEASPANFRVLAFNVLSNNSESEPVISFVKQEKPDLAIFMEASGEWPENLKMLDDTFPYHQSAEEIDMQIYSTMPLTDSQVKLHGKYRGYVMSEINQGTRVSIIASHNYPPVVFGSQGFTWRNEQLQEIGETLATLENPVIVVGDLNAPMWSHYYQKTFSDSGLRNTRQGFGIMPTYEPNNFFKAIPVDHCLVSEDIQVVNMRLGPSLGSDHVPIIVDLSIPNLNKNQPQLKPELKPAITL